MNLFKRLWNWLKKHIIVKEDYYSVSFDNKIKLDNLPEKAQEISFYKMKMRPNAGVFEVTSKSNPNKSGICIISYREVTTGKEGKMDEDIFFFNFRQLQNENIDYKNLFSTVQNKH